MTAPLHSRVQRGLLVATALAYSAGYAAVGLALLLGTLGWELLATRRVPWEPSRAGGPFAAFLLAFLLSGLVSAHRAVALGSLALAAVTVVAGYNPMVRHIRRAPDLVHRVLASWAMGGVLAAAWGLLIHLQTRRPAALPELERNSLATALLVAFLLSLRLWSVWRGWAVAALAGGDALMALTLLRTDSRGGWLGLLAGLVVFFALAGRRQVRVAAVVLALLLVAAALGTGPGGRPLAQRVESVLDPALNENRIVLARAAVAIFRDHPLVGTGLNTFSLVHPSYTAASRPRMRPHSAAHNIFLNMAAEGGLLGLASFLAVVGALGAAGWRWWRRARSPGEAATAAAVLAAYVGMLVHDQFDATLNTVHLGVGLWWLGAIMTAMESVVTRAVDPGGRRERPTVLVVSNGHGEDAVGMALARIFGPGVDVTAYPLVGLGAAYQEVPVLEPRRILPSGGFGFRNHLPGLWADLRAGVLGLWWQQRRRLEACRGRFDAIVAIGDFYCLWMAAHAGRPVVYVATAKSEHAEPHRWLELRLMRRLPAVVFARDEKTAAALAARGVPARYVGNPLMDTVGPDGPDLRPQPGLPTVLLLPGSRGEAYANLALLLALADRVGAAEQVNVLCALAPSVDLDRVRATASRAGWQADGDGLRSSHVTVRLTRAFGAAVRVADVVVGLAGTANEQAAGLGKPVVAFPGPGPQFTRHFLRLQQRILGDALVATRSWEDAADATVRLLRDPSERARRGEAGRQRMGPPGAVGRIASEILTLLACPGTERG